MADQKTETYSATSIKCEIFECKARCLCREPTINTVNKYKDTLKQAKLDKMIGNDNILDVKDVIRGTITLTIGNVNLDSLYINKAHCDVDIIMTYGCISCTDSPYIIFKSYNIKNEGIIPYESNCSFKTPYLSCNEEPQLLELNEEFEYCQIYLTSINKTIIAHIEYNFSGALSPINTIVGRDNSLTAIKSIFSDSNFLNTLGKTAFACALFGTISTVVIKIIQICIITKSNHDINKQHE